MTTEPAPRHQRALKVLGFVFPLTALLAMYIGFSLGDVNWFYALLGIGLGLSVAYLVLSLVRSVTRSSGHTTVSVLLAFLLMGIAVFGMIARDVLSSLSNTFREPPTLAESLQRAADSASGSASAFLKTGKSGALIGSGWMDSHWTNPKGGEIPIAISWTKNARGIMVTASPGGAVPKGQDGTPRTQQVRTDGMLEYPLDYYEQQGKKEQSSTFDLFSPEFFMFNDLVQASAKPIIDYAKGHGGALPDKAEGATLLSTAKKVFDCKPDPTSPSRFMRVEITKYTYRPLADGIFAIDYDWECSQPNDPPKGNPDFKARGTISMQYTAEGKLAMKTDEKEDPFSQFLMAVEQQGGEEEARERKAAKEAKAAKAAKEAKKNSTGKNSGG